jgi:NADH-quinone oxidoreductase subunit N
VEPFKSPDIDWAALAPILILMGASMTVLVVGVFLPRSWKRFFGAFLAALALAGAAVAAGILFGMDDQPSTLVNGSLVRDRFAELGQIFVAVAGFLAVGVSYWETRAVHGDSPAHVSDDRERVVEYYALLLAAVAGMCFFLQATTLLSLFLGLEWFSIALYVLTAIGVDRIASLEAGLKYLIVGSFGSAILLFGSAFVYGATGELRFVDIAAGAADADRLFFVAGLAMILVGLAFKVSAAPFHMWTPDVYQGAPTPLTAFMSAATKVAALMVTMRVLLVAFPSEEELWTVALAVLAAISLLWGNLAALVQTDVKRMLAYSSVSHAGFLLIPLATASAFGGRTLVFYLVSYGAMSIGAFAVVAARERELGRPATYENMAGFGWERPALGAAMTFFMFGFIGLPPAGLFFGKFFAFAAAYNKGWTWLVIIGVLATVISIPYYLGVVRSMYMGRTEPVLAVAGGSPPRDWPLGFAVAACVAISIASFVFAGPLIELARDAVGPLVFLG